MALPLGPPSSAPAAHRVGLIHYKTHREVRPHGEHDVAALRDFEQLVTLADEGLQAFWDVVVHQARVVLHRKQSTRGPDVQPCGSRLLTFLAARHRMPLISVAAELTHRTALQQRPGAAPRNRVEVEGSGGVRGRV